MRQCHVIGLATRSTCTWCWLQTCHCKNRARTNRTHTNRRRTHRETHPPTSMPAGEMAIRRTSATAPMLWRDQKLLRLQHTRRLAVRNGKQHPPTLNPGNPPTHTRTPRTEPFHLPRIAWWTRGNTASRARAQYWPRAFKCWEITMEEQYRHVKQCRGLILSWHNRQRCIPCDVNSDVLFGCIAPGGRNLSSCHQEHVGSHGCELGLTLTNLTLFLESFMEPPVSFNMSCWAPSSWWNRSLVSFSKQWWCIFSPLASNVPNKRAGRTSGLVKTRATRLAHYFSHNTTIFGGNVFSNWGTCLFGHLSEF